MIYRNDYDATDWTKLKANGDAAGIPKLLVVLRQADPAARANAWRELVDIVHHQGAIYDATVATFHFLEGSLQSPLGGDLLQQIHTGRFVPRGITRC